MRDSIAYGSVQEDLVLHAKESRLPRMFERITNNALFNCNFNSINPQLFLHFTATSKIFYVTTESGAPSTTESITKSITKMAPTLRQKLVDKISQHTEYKKLLQSSTSSKILVIEGLDPNTYKRPSSAAENPRNKQESKTSCVQICPHESLSFERMKRTIHLPGLKFTGDRVSALTNNPNHMSPVAGIVLCKPFPKSFSSLKADSYYKYQWGVAGDYDGLTLCVCWTMSFDDHMSIAGSVSDMRTFLDKLDIHLCPHTKMSHLAANLRRLCNPCSPAQGPVVAYEEDQSSRMIDRCRGCHSTFQTYKEGSTCHILVKRYLGKGDSAYEKRWLAQCGGQKHRLRSLGVAALQSLRI